MQIKISARHGHLTEATQQFIQDKAEKLLHIFERLTMIEVTVDLQKDVKEVEFRVQAEHKHRSGWPAWATWGLVGTGVAVASGVVIAVIASSSRSAGGSEWTLGPTTH